ncbi:hypothetical protein Acsp04_27350 [Actinomadura sp. NBRC 104425]|uniref:hypothetical protein n=1 Tax=Actinomadura sp. NBRC 104425 TaxID=3032204 RepID=UPI0024A4A42B|nr:hypothetical protein [Actinomadura sp. NBRC 104425]GLZ12500.1 hypothetical protein Acsp04_27350 [Actinomadura sp. NBRC 104425]
MSVRTTGAGRSAGTVRVAVPVLAAGLAVAAAPPAAADAAPGEAQAAAVGCRGGKGDAAALVRAIRAGGDITLSRGCTYTLTRPYGTQSVLPTITRSTRVNGRNATIAYTGRAPVSSFFHVGGGPSGQNAQSAQSAPLAEPQIDISGVLGGLLDGLGSAAGLRRATAPQAVDQLRIELRDLRLTTRNARVTRAITVRRSAQVSLVNTGVVGHGRAAHAVPNGALQVAGDTAQPCTVDGAAPSVAMDVRPAPARGAAAADPGTLLATLMPAVGRARFAGAPLSLGAPSGADWGDDWADRVWRDFDWGRYGFGGLPDNDRPGPAANTTTVNCRNVQGRTISVTSTADSRTAGLLP